jgi:DNA repair exonuclease SbcCD ATPase subunit
MIVVNSEYTSVKDRKTQIQKDKEKCLKEISSLKQKSRLQDLRINDLQEVLKTTEKDLAESDNEKESLKNKVKLLEKLIESPNSRASLQRVLESPMPSVIGKRFKTDENDSGCSPILSVKSTSQLDQHSLVDNSSKVLLPVQKASNQQSFSSISSGFNGLGGCSNFVPPVRSFILSL